MLILIIPLALSTMPFVFGVLGSSKPVFNMIGFADFIQFRGFLTELSFLGFNKPIRKFRSVIRQNMRDFKREKFKASIHKIFCIFTCLGLVNPIKQTSGSSVDSNKIT
jgi:hypothetical protein